MSQRPIILFDVMETLVVEPFFTAIPQLFGMTCDQLLAAKHPTSWIEFEHGRITEDEYLTRFFQDQRPVDGAAVRRCLSESYQWVDGMQELLAELHTKGYEIHALSNYSTWYLLIEEALGLSQYLQWTFVSCLMEVRKPDPRAFLIPTEQLGVKPGECLFIDDRPVNVEAAKAVHMDAIHFQDATRLRAELVGRLLPGSN